MIMKNTGANEEADPLIIIITGSCTPAAIPSNLRDQVVEAEAPTGIEPAEKETPEFPPVELRIGEDGISTVTDIPPSIPTVPPTTLPWLFFTSEYTN